jgi:hypothetical protein
MTVAIQARPPRFIPSPTSLKRFTVDEYHRMIDAGAFNDDQPVELLEGLSTRWDTTRRTTWS